MPAERVYDLGESGESAATRLLAAAQLGHHLEPIFVLASSPKALGELRRRLQETSPDFSRLEPSLDITQRIDEIAGKSSGKASRPVLWIEPEVFDPERWKETLVLFNRRREWLHDRAPWLLVLAGPLVEGPQSLVNLCARHAPDFYSISISLLVQEEPKLLPTKLSRLPFFSADGRFTFAPPAELPLGRDKTGADTKRTEARHRAVAARYRAAVAAVHGQMRFIGFPAAVAGTQPNLRVQELFVPVQLALRGPAAFGKEDQRLSTNGLLGRLLPSNEKKGRFVVLGDPGSGKTTLCRFAAAFFTGELPRKGVELRGEPLPLFLPFRDYMRRRHEVGKSGLVDYLVEQARSHLQVGLDRISLEEELETGNAVLLLDGLNEVGNPQERCEVRDLVLAFCRRYPRLPVLLTSRFAGYEDAPLPEDEFERLELKPFEDEDLRVFVTNWYTVQEPSDPQARERGIADLLAALTVDPRVRALASNPLLATLIALVHRTEARLPRERAKLYELVVSTLLETWPMQARRKFQEIDAGLQRIYLEDFALSQQERRSNPRSEVAFERRVLVEEILGRQQQATPKETLRRTAESWVEFLAVGTGIIIEQRPGVFAFLHLSLLEYLAACALDRREEALEERIARKLNDTVWQEVLLLAVGRHAADLPFLNRLFLRLQEERAGYFLLCCLREEASFDSSKRSAILATAASILLKEHPNDWGETEEIVRKIERFSSRHGDETRRWLELQLGFARGESLRAAVALSFDSPQEIQGILERRTDLRQCSLDLQEFWPGTALGDWAAIISAGGSSDGFFERTPSSLLVSKCLASLSGGHGLSSFCSPSIRSRIRSARSYFDLADEHSLRVSSHVRPGGHGIPVRISFVGTAESAIALCRWPRPPVSRTPSDLVDTECQEYQLYFARQFVRSLATSTGLVEYADEKFGGSLLALVSDFAEDEMVDVQRELWLACGESLKLADFFSPEVVGIFSRITAMELGEEFSATCPTSEQGGRFRPTSMAEERLIEAEFYARKSLEEWLSATMILYFSFVEAAAYTTFRVQNLAVLYHWLVVDSIVPADPEPEQLALYFQLGWTQSTTTHEWPATERWIALMKAGPPAHWLPRAQWHLCWLLHDNVDAGHQRAFNEALREGLADSDLGRHEVATTLEQVIGFYP